MGHNGTLSRGRAAFVAALLQHPTITAAAAAAHISRNTAYRYLDEPGVRAAIREAQAALMDNVTVCLGAACSEAIRALYDVLRDPEATAAVKVGAARVLLSLWPSYIEISNILARIEALERIP